MIKWQQSAANWYSGYVNGILWYQVSTQLGDHILHYRRYDINIEDNDVILHEIPADEASMWDVMETFKTIAAKHYVTKRKDKIKDILS
jgi:hypothetical protein